MQTSDKKKPKKGIDLRLNFQYNIRLNFPAVLGEIK